MAGGPGRVRALRGFQAWTDPAEVSQWGTGLCGVSSLNGERQQRAPAGGSQPHGAQRQCSEMRLCSSTAGRVTAGMPVPEGVAHVGHSQHALCFFSCPGNHMWPCMSIPLPSHGPGDSITLSAVITCRRCFQAGPHIRPQESGPNLSLGEARDRVQQWKCLPLDSFSNEGCLLPALTKFLEGRGFPGSLLSSLGAVRDLWGSPQSLPEVSDCARGWGPTLSCLHPVQP